MPRHGKQRTRLFVDASLEAPRLELDADQAHYLGRVLRCREGDSLVVFNARGRERSATVESLSRRHPVVALGDDVELVPEPEAPLVLLQSIVKSDAMDLIVQKATELGVAAIIATRTEFSVVRLDAERAERKLAHWRRIAGSACEQSGRHHLPRMEIHRTLEDAIEAIPSGLMRVAFDGSAKRGYDTSIDAKKGFCLAVGPEGGFSENDLASLEAAGFELYSMGPRTLRAETAAISAISFAQFAMEYFG